MSLKQVKMRVPMGKCDAAIDYMGSLGYKFHDREAHRNMAYSCLYGYSDGSLMWGNDEERFTSTHKNFEEVRLPTAASVLQGGSALDVQIGGDHYKKLKIQPMEYSMANGLDACQHTVIKYVTRFRDKGGIADLEKAKHTIDMLIEMEQKNNAVTK